MTRKPSESEEEYFARIEFDYKSLKVDKRSGCEGVWLDPGELEAVARMEKSMVGRIFGG